MVVMMKLKYVDELSGGRKRFRRRYPKAVADVLGESVFQVDMRAREGAELFTEHKKLLTEFEKIVTKARRRAAEDGQLSPLEHWREAANEAEEMLAGIKGSLSDGEKREVLADELQRRSANSVLIRAVLDPNNESEFNPEPPVTMLDAKKMYLKERMNGGAGRNQRNRLDRVCRRVEEALAPLHELPLVELKREHARKLRDFMLAQRKSDGTPLAPRTVRRELDMVRTMVSVAIVEYDLEGRAQNPFKDLDLPKKDTAPDNEWALRDPLPREIIRKRFPNHTVG